MGTYIMNFTVYTLAMSGLIFFALYVYKKVMGGSFHSSESKMLSIEETLSINPRKTLMVVKAGEERFLIASDVDKTTLISKLAEDDISPLKNKKEKYFNEIYKEQPIKNTIEQKKISKETKTQTQQPIHLEVIRKQNPQFQRHRNTPRTYGKMVNIDVGAKKNYEFPTMKEMAMKINEL